MTIKLTKLRVYGAGLSKSNGEKDVAGTCEYEATGVFSAKVLEQFIIRCVENHDALVGELKKTVDLYDCLAIDADTSGAKENYESKAKFMREILELATGEKYPLEPIYGAA